MIVLKFNAIVVKKKDNYASECYYNKKIKIRKILY